MNPELLRFHEQIVSCVHPEDLFGALASSDNDNERVIAVKVLYRKFAAISHEDKYLRPDEKRIAHLAFTKLNDLHKQALEKIKAGKYGTSDPLPKVSLTPVSMKGPKGLYIVKSGFTSGDVSTLYRGEV